MRKIVVNTRLLRKEQMDGIGWFTYNTMKYITAANPDIEFHFLFDTGIQEEFVFSKNIVPKNLFPPAKHAVLNLAWFEWSTKNYLKKINPDLFLSPDGILALGWNGPQYGVIHDINFIHIPEDLKWTNRRYYNYFIPRSARKAARLSTVSSYSKQDIVRNFSIDPEKIDVVYCGINSFFEPTTDAEKQEVKRKFTDGQDYFLFVGALHPRKNIIRLMQAYELFRKATPGNMKLVLAGKEMYRTGEMHEYHSQMKFKHDVIFTGRVQDKELKQLMGAAFCLTFVPYFEGFGIPPLEAMQCNVPVIASNVTSIPEVVGDAALLVDPLSIENISSAMQRVVEDQTLRQELVLKGSYRKSVFSWERTASLLWTSIAKVL